MAPPQVRDPFRWSVRVEFARYPREVLQWSLPAGWRISPNEPCTSPQRRPEFDQLASLPSLCEAASRALPPVELLPAERAPSGVGGWHGSDRRRDRGHHLDGRPTDRPEQRRGTQGAEPRACGSGLRSGIGEDQGWRRSDVAELPRRSQEDRTIGQVFHGRDGQAYRPSMFITLTLPSAVTTSERLDVTLAETLPTARIKATSVRTWSCICLGSTERRTLLANSRRVA